MAELPVRQSPPSERGEEPFSGGRSSSAGRVEGRSGQRPGVLQLVLLPLNAFLHAPPNLLLCPLLPYKSSFWKLRAEGCGQSGGGAEFA